MLLMLQNSGYHLHISDNHVQLAEEFGGNLSEFWVLLLLLISDWVLFFHCSRIQLWKYSCEVSVMDFSFASDMSSWWRKEQGGKLEVRCFRRVSLLERELLRFCATAWNIIHHVDGHIPLHTGYNLWVLLKTALVSFAIENERKSRHYCWFIF